MSEVCVIVINFCAAAITRRCLESLRSEVFDTLYVIDNSANVAASQEFLAMMAAFRAQSLPWETVVAVNDQNIGFGRAINRAIQADRASGRGHRRYLLLNNDAVGCPGFIAGLVDRANQSDQIFLVAPSILWGGEWVCLRWYQRVTGHISSNPCWGSFAYATGCCLLVDERLLVDGGQLFDEDFFMYGEDVLLAWRALQNNQVAVCVQAAVVEHEGSASSSFGSFFYEYHIAHSHMILGRKLAVGWLDAWLCHLGRLIYLAIRALRRSLAFKSMIPIRAYLAVVKAFIRRQWLPL